MAIRIDKAAATRVLVQAANMARDSASQDDWVHDIERFSRACERAKTHIAFLGTAMLAKATDLRVDVFAIKAKAHTDGAYSARALAQHVLVPNALELGIDLGVSGREPLNNQPYFRAQRATETDLLPLVKANAVDAVKQLHALLTRLEQVTTSEQARAALRAFITVRRRHVPRYGHAPSPQSVHSLQDLVSYIESFVAASSEGGKRAQAVAAGFMDLFAGENNVALSRVNDPDRRFPGDICVQKHGNLERVVEVRDKPVSKADILLFVRKAASHGARKALVLAVSPKQRRLDGDTLAERAAQFGVELKVFYGWKEYAEQAVLWSACPGPDAVTRTFPLIRKRLIKQEVDTTTVSLWDQFIAPVS